MFDDTTYAQLVTLLQKRVSKLMIRSISQRTAERSITINSQLHDGEVANGLFEQEFAALNNDKSSKVKSSFCDLCKKTGHTPLKCWLRAYCEKCKAIGHPTFKCTVGNKAITSINTTTNTDNDESNDKKLFKLTPMFEKRYGHNA